MIAVNRENGNGDVDVRVFIIDVVKEGSAISFKPGVTQCDLTYPWNTSLPSLSISSSQGLSP